MIALSKDDASTKGAKEKCSWNSLIPKSCCIQNTELRQRWDFERKVSLLEMELLTGRQWAWGNDQYGPVATVT